MSYEPPKIARIKLKNSNVISNAVLATSTMQLPGFISLEAEVNGKRATRFVAVDAVEEILIDNDELYKTFPCSFIPEIRLRASLQKDLAASIEEV